MDNSSNNNPGLIEAVLKSIEKNIFPSFAKATVIIMVIFAIVNTLKEFFIKPMECFNNHMQLTVLDEFCLTQSTYVDRLFPLANTTEHLFDYHYKDENNKVRYYAYYRWMFAALYLQAIFLATPYLFWKIYQRINVGKLINVFPSERKYCENNYAKYKIGYLYKTHNFLNRYVYEHYSFQLLNVINIVGQICIMNAFVGDTFGSEGLYGQVFSRQPESRFWNLLHQLFPTILMCSRHDIDPAEKLDHPYDVCIVPQNVINARIYVFIWLLLHAVAIISASVFIYHVFTLFFPSIKCYRLRSSKCTVPPNDRDVLFNKISIGSRFLLQMIQHNMNDLAYDQLIFSISQRFQFDSTCSMSCVQVEILNPAYVEPK